MQHAIIETSLKTAKRDRGAYTLVDSLRNIPNVLPYCLSEIRQTPSEISLDVVPASSPRNHCLRLDARLTESASGTFYYSVLSILPSSLTKAGGTSFLR